MNNNSMFFKINVIKCCKDCVPPKRHIGCHSSCKEYLNERMEHDKIKNEYLKHADVEKRLVETEIDRSYRIHKKAKSGPFKNRR